MKLSKPLSLLLATALLVVAWAMPASARLPALSMQAWEDGTESGATIDQQQVPNIGVSPASISATQSGGEVTTHLLTISNSGPGVLEFALHEIPGSSPDAGSGDSAPTGALDAAAGIAGTGPADLPPSVRVEGPFTVDPQVESQLEVGSTADFFIWLRQRADLGPAYEITDKEARRAYVYHALSATASRTQAEIRTYLDGRGLSYAPLWINNAILVYGGDQAVVEAMRARDDVLRIRGVYTQMSIPDPEQLAIVTLDESHTAAVTDWNINIVNAPEVWSELGITGEGVVVANIDTGVRYTHDALNPSYRGNLGGSYEHNYNWYPPTYSAENACSGAATAPCDWNGHGSHTMGTMIGGDGEGPFDHDIGMAPDAQWIACMGCDTPPNQCSDTALTLCAQWMVAPTDLNGANPDPSRAPDVVNNSWGGGGEDPWYHSYVEAWNAANIIPVFSAGNEGPGCQTLGSPGSYDAVLGVGGTDSQDYNYTYTSRGPGSGNGVFPVQKPDVSAPGQSVPSAYRFSDSSYASLSGTSMAAPHVSGLVALMRQVDGSISRDEIWDILTSTAVTSLTIKNGTWCGAGPGLPNYVFGYGRIDALAAVQEMAQGSDVPWVGEDPTAGTVPAGGSLDVTVTFTAPLDAPGVYTAILRVASNDPEDPAVDVPLTMTVLGITPDLHLDKSVAPGEQVPGGRVTFTLTLGNSGGSGAPGVVLSDTLPAEVRFVDAEPAGWAYDPVAHEVVWTLDLPGGAELEATLWGEIQAGTPPGTWLANQAYLLWEATKMKAGAALYVLPPPPDLRLNKTVAPAEQAPGELVTFTLALGNSGGSGAPGVVLSDTLPAEVTFVDAEPAGWAYEPVAHEVVWTLDLPRGAELEATLWAEVQADTPPGTWLTNRAYLLWEGLVLDAEAALYVSREYDLYLPLLFGHAPEEQGVPGDQWLPGHAHPGRASRR